MTPKTKSFWLASIGPAMVVLNLGAIVLIGWFVLKYPNNFLLRTVDRLFGIILETTPPSVSSAQRHILECSKPASDRAEQSSPQDGAGLTSEQRAARDAAINRCIADAEKKN
jgi:hypothetical protein